MDGRLQRVKLGACINCIGCWDVCLFLRYFETIEVNFTCRNGDDPSYFGRSANALNATSVVENLVIKYHGTDCFAKPRNRISYAHDNSPLLLFLKRSTPSSMQRPQNQPSEPYAYISAQPRKFVNPHLLASTASVPPFSNAGTHAQHMGQRFVWLDVDYTSLNYTAATGGVTVTVEGPPGNTIAPPGYYYLFVHDSNIPSKATWVQLM